ncbi:hypothetical protein HDU98_009898 [Podochytrium sp. JEL0797]|nr:hypothetical protein HDU98_009898 [Podochytrium sp. JEL0797]
MRRPPPKSKKPRPRPPVATPTQSSSSLSTSDAAMFRADQLFNEGRLGEATTTLMDSFLTDPPPALDEKAAWLHKIALYSLWLTETDRLQMFHHQKLLVSFRNRGLLASHLHPFIRAAMLAISDALDSDPNLLRRAKELMDGLTANDISELSDEMKDRARRSATPFQEDYIPPWPHSTNSPRIKTPFGTVELRH